MPQQPRSTPGEHSRKPEERTQCIVMSLPKPQADAFIFVPPGFLRLADNVWQPLPLASRLGMDLVYTKLHSTDKTLYAFGSNPNTTLTAFTLDCDPSSTSFGTSTHTHLGGVAFRFTRNEQQIRQCVLEPLEIFITTGMRATRAVLASDGIKKATKLYQKLSAREFKLYWKKFRAEMAERFPGEGWRKIPRPVTLAARSCEACGREGGEDHVLLKCPCGKALYCDKSCQAEDRKAHKPFCLVR